MFEAVLSYFIDNFSYLLIILLMAIESSFIPFPSEAVVPPAAFLAYYGNMNVFLVVICATVGAGIGSIFNYYLALFLGRPVVYKFANSKLGHLCLLSQEKVENAERYFDKNGARSTFFGRLIPAVRQLISIPAGLARMKFSRFLAYTLFGAAIWNSVLAGLGYYLGSVITLDADNPAEAKEELKKQISYYNSEITWAIIGIVALVVIYFVAKHFWQKRKK